MLLPRVMHRIASLFLLVLCIGCGSRDRVPDPSYQVRGRVVERSGSGADVRATVAHEAIAEFKDRDGKVTGMDAMTMAFGIAPGVDDNALQPGTQWQLTFTVRWTQEPALLITAAQPLASDQPLQLGSSKAH